MEVKLINAKEKDTPSIVSTFIEAFNEKGYKENWTPKTARDYILYYKRAKGSIYVIKLKNELVGFVITREWPVSKGNILCIEDIAVKKQFQGKGIGSHIMLEIEKLAKKRRVTQIVLTTGKKGKAADFYKKLKYKESKDTAVFRKSLV